MMKPILALTSLVTSVGLVTGTEFPKIEISNGQIRASVYLPDAKNGFYRGTRFDWSGVVYSLKYQGHEYYGPWFQRTDPKVHDFIYDGSDIVTNACSATMGPVDEFDQLGWEQSKPGGTFVKIGVGALRKPEGGRYDHFHFYEVADPGKWSVTTRPDSVEFVQELAATSLGYGYRYRKTLRLTAGKSEMVVEHSLRNTGKRAIETTLYNHNFLVLDGQAPGPGFVITVPFQIQSQHPPNRGLAEIRGNQIVFLKTFEGRDLVEFAISGFGADPSDNQIRIETAKAGAGMTITGNRPLVDHNLWSIRTTVAMEPFIAIAVEPGSEFAWTSTYNFYTLP
jgi:hypothetical protein